MSGNRFSFSKSSRRELLRAGMYGVGVSAAALPLPLFAQASAALIEGRLLEAILKAEPGGVH